MQIRSIRVAGKKRAYLMAAAALMAAMPRAIRAQVNITANGDGISFNAINPNQYHAQFYPYSCAIASMEMELDEPNVTATNPFVQNLINQGDQFAQGYMYNMVHANLIGAPVAPLNQIPTNVTYNAANAPQLNNNNFFYATYAYPGSDMFSTQFGLNVLNNPNVAGLGGDNSVAYAAYNLASYDYSNRTIAAAIAQYKAPAVVGINPNPNAPANQLAGQHAIAVNGVSYVPLDANASPTRNAKYIITGFFIQDPWTGYAKAHPGQGLPDGAGEHTWVSTNQIQLPGPGGVVAAPFSWGRYFRPSNPSPTPYTTIMNGVGYKFEVEPQGPELPDDGNGGLYSSLTTPLPELTQDLTAADAFADAATDLASDGLGIEAGFENGHFDTDTSHELLLNDPFNVGVGDWLVPYDGSGGSDDVTGALLIDEATGVIDQATWFDNGEFMTLAQMDELFTDEMNGIVVDDNEIPEPASLGLISFAAALLLRRRSSRPSAATPY